MVKSETHGPIGIVTIDRPERRNALGSEVMRGLSAALRGHEADDRIKAIVLTGAAPGFCAGSDLKELSLLSAADMCAHEAETSAIVRSIAKLEIPVVAAIEGFALGGGLMLAIGCDALVSAADAT